VSTITNYYNSVL